MTTMILRLLGPRCKVKCQGKQESKKCMMRSLSSLRSKGTNMADQLRTKINLKPASNLKVFKTARESKININIRIKHLSNHKRQIYKQFTSHKHPLEPYQAKLIRLNISTTSINKSRLNIIKMKRLLIKLAQEDLSNI